MLHQDAVTYSDGGGLTRAALNPIYGADRVARFLIGVARKGGRELRRESVLINGQPGFIGFLHGELSSAMVLDIEDDRVRTVYIVVNPQKLQNLAKEKHA